MSNLMDLNVNGRLFPHWIVKNFKKFYLPEIIRKEGEDPCNEVYKEELTKYQKFVSQFLSYESPFNSILLFHGLGSGKTANAINIYNVLFNFYPNWNVFVIIPAALKDDPWLKDLKRWLSKGDYKKRFNNITFVSYDSPFADKDFLEKVKKKDNSKDTIYIFDEAHRFITNVYNNIVSTKGKRAKTIYDYIVNEKKENNRTRVLLLSATPVVNDPFEYAIIFNLLRPGTFPKEYTKFEELYVTNSGYKMINKNTKNMFQRRIMGLTSYYMGATPDKFAKKKVHYKKLIMGKYQERIYNHFEDIEEKKEKIARRYGKRSDKPSTYLTYTRQSCNFVFPNISKSINGEKRPRPSQFKLDITDKSLFVDGNDEENIARIKKKKEGALYVKSVNKFITALFNHFKELHKKDIMKKHTINTDMSNLKKKYNSSFIEFWNNKDRKSLLLTEMYNCSPKYVYIIFNLLKKRGPVLVYSNYVDMEGLGIFKLYLQFFSFISFDKDLEVNKLNISNINKFDKDYKYDNKRYMEFHGKIDKAIRLKNKNIFNLSANKYSKFIKIIMISPAGAEGLNLRNVRQVHILEPFWNEVKIEQVMGRAIRICSHKDLPLNERKVDVFRYTCVRKNGKETSDEKLELLSRRKNNLLSSFTQAVKEGAVDCNLFMNHNMLGESYNCFKFDENSLFEKNIGPAFVKDVEFDIKMNNGSNSTNSISKKIKVRKIKAVIEETENKFIDEDTYWVNDETNVVYNKFEQPVGKLKTDNNNDFELHKNMYVISNIIKIPNFKLYE